MAIDALARSELFLGLPLEAVADVAARMRRRTFAPGDVVCRSGESGESLFFVVTGLARVTLADADGSPRAVARLRRGDLIGEMSLVTGEPRTATVVAAVPTTVLELDRDHLAGLIGAHPQILANLNRILTRKLAETTARVGDRPARGEAVALLAGELGGPALADVVASTEAASARPVAVLDARASLERALAALDDALAANGTVLVLSQLDPETVRPLTDAVDRTVAVVGSAEELAQLRAALPPGTADGRPVEVVAVAGPDGERVPADATAATPVIRVGRRVDGTLAPNDAAWVGRHLARTKLGLALGAGGAKGYAHVGVLEVLEAAGYVVDAVAGSSIGAIVGSWLALGRSATEVDATMQAAFTPDVVADIFKLSLSGTSTGLGTMTRVLRETTGDRTFADLVLPLVVMTVDLDGRRPAPVTEGPLWEALLAATALAGMFPPYQRGGRRHVDGLALVPVPTEAVLDAGADITLSVNIISRQTLPAWPGTVPPPEEPPGPRSRMLDTILEVMDLAQLDASERHAARADVVVTPTFGPSTWRDFHLADLFLEAGREAAEAGLETLRSLARPQPSRTSR